jgi:putative polyhydroxyalkanoate system protein
MPDITVVRRHALPLSEARALAERTVEDFAERYGVEARWRGDVLRFRASGAEGRVHLSPTEIRLDVKLGLLLRPFKAKLEHRIERHLDRLLAPHATKRTQKRSSRSSRRT